MVKPCEFKSHPRHHKRMIRTPMESRSSYFLYKQAEMALLEVSAFLFYEIFFGL